MEKTKNHYNLSKLIRITVCDAQASTEYKYKKKIKFLGITLRKEGIYNWHGLVNEVPTYHFIKDGIVYSMPHCKMVFHDDYIYTIHCENHESAKNKAAEIIEASKCNFLSTLTPNPTKEDGSQH